MANQSQTIGAIDLGDSAVSAAILTGAQTIWLTGPGGGSRRWPACVFAGESGFAFGDEAERLGAQAPGRLVRRLRSLLGESEPLSLAGVSATSEELLVALLKNIEVQARTHGRIDQWVITCPAGYQSYLRSRLSQVAADAGLLRPTILDEPLAAVAGLEDSGLYLIIDAGAERASISLVRRAAKKIDYEFPTLAVEGVGGEDWSARLIHLALATAPGAKAELEGFGLEGAARAHALAAELELAKRTLDYSSAASIRLSSGVHAFSREEFERETEPIAARLAGEALEFLTGAGVSAGAVSGALLIGGASRAPLLRTKLASSLPIAPILPTDPELATVQGALLWARPVAPERRVDPGALAGAGPASKAALFASKPDAGKTQPGAPVSGGGFKAPPVQSKPPVAKPPATKPPLAKPPISVPPVPKPPVAAPPAAPPPMSAPRTQPSDPPHVDDSFDPSSDHPLFKR